MEIELGEIKIVSIRTKWSNEATDFTPWLAEDENIAKLGNALGFELEVENTEVSVGPYFADILAKDTVTGSYVVIENQLGKTDHDHLGKSITYASVLDASAIIWIAGHFTEEHKKSLDWLNDHTTDEISFYGVQIELWQIDNSKPALRFNVISSPTEIIRQSAKIKAGENLSDNNKLQYNYWTKFRDKLQKTNQIPSLQAPRPQYWFDVALGKAGIFLSNIASPDKKRIGLRIYISNKICDSIYPKLLEYKLQIENELNQKLEWNPNPSNRDKIIALYKDFNFPDTVKWDESLDWHVDLTIKFRKVFSKIIREIDKQSFANSN